MKGYKSVGYIAGKKSNGWCTIMIDDGRKEYYGLLLNDALDALTGRVAYMTIYKKSG